VIDHTQLSVDMIITCSPDCHDRLRWVGRSNLWQCRPPERAADEHENPRSRKIAQNQMPRKTTTQKILEGDAGKRGKHVLQRRLAAEPHAQVGLPDAPAHLSARARAAWDFWREQLELMQLDHAPDAIALEGACVNYARAVEADLILTREGIVIDEPTFYRGERLRGVARRKKHPP